MKLRKPTAPPRIVFVDQKKQANKKLARKKVKINLDFSHFLIQHYAYEKTKQSIQNP